MVRVVCPYCGYSWDSRARGRYLKCPSCYRGFRNPYWGSPTTTSTTTTTTTSTTTPTTSTTTDAIEVYVLDFSPGLWGDLRDVAEEYSGLDEHGVEVLVVDAGLAEEVLKLHGISLEDEGGVLK